jgi:DHA2 family multidrug resistance protein
VPATVIAGLFAMLAPALGPLIGGYISETQSWHWLFLVNVAPGIVVAGLVATLVRVDRADWSLLWRVDLVAVALLAVFLAMLELFLKEGSERGWTDAQVLLMLAAAAAAGPLLVWRCLRRADPLVDFSLFRDRWFSAGCWYSFVLGLGLYGATYLLPLFLGFVRHHEPLEIGTIMVVTGIAQLVCAPIAAIVEKRYNPVWIAGLGFALFAAGMLLNSNETSGTDFQQLILPQVVRGAALMLCLLPVTTLALQHQPADRLGNASALFNLMRNLGGAVGLALIDTVLEGRAPIHVARLIERLQAGDPTAALFVGLPVDRFHNQPMGDVDQATRDLVAPLVEQAGAVMAFNDAWLLMGGLLVLSLAAIPLLSRMCGKRRVS